MRFKIENAVGIIIDETDHRRKKWSEWLAANPVDGIEIRTIGAGGDKAVYIQNASQEQVRELASWVGRANVKVHGLAAGLGKCDLNVNAQVKRHLAMVPRLVEAANILGTLNIRAFAGWRRRDIPGTWKTEVVPFFQGILKILDKLGSKAMNVVIVVENEPATGCATLEDVALLREALGNDQRIMCLFDPGNYGFDVVLVRAAWSFKANITELVIEHIRQFNAIIRLVHLKATWMDKNGNTVETMKLDGGMFDFPRILEVLREYGVVVPWDLEPHRAGEGQQLEEAMRAVPGGPGYGNPANCTKDLRILRAIMNPAQ